MHAYMDEQRVLLERIALGRMVLLRAEGPLPLVR